MINIEETNYIRHSIQDNKSDLGYMPELAKKYGKDVYMFGEKVYVGEEILREYGDVVLERGKNLIRLEHDECVNGIAESRIIAGQNRADGEQFERKE